MAAPTKHACQQFYQNMQQRQPPGFPWRGTMHNGPRMRGYCRPPVPGFGRPPFSPPFRGNQPPPWRTAGEMSDCTDEFHHPPDPNMHGAPWIRLPNIFRGNVHRGRGLNNRPNMLKRGQCPGPMRGTGPRPGFASHQQMSPQLPQRGRQQRISKRKANNDLPSTSNEYDDGADDTNLSTTVSQKKGKKKANKKDLPEYNLYACDICDRGFQSEEAYEAHIQTHEKCSYEGCNFTAHPKVVQKHIHWQHLTGCAEKIKRLTTMSEIQKWREERKRNYPTKENIMRKKASSTDKRERGEVLETKSFGKFGRLQKKRMRKQVYQEGGTDVGKMKKTSHTRQDNEDVSQQAVKEDKPEVHESQYGRADPMSYFLTGHNDEDSDTEAPTVEPIMKSDPSVPALPGGLGTLLAAYGSDSDEEVTPFTLEVREKPSTKMETKDVEHILEAANVTLNCDEECHSEDHMQSKADEQPEHRHQINSNVNKRQGMPPARGRSRKRRRGGGPQQQPMLMRRPTLLEKLLAPEIRHERNVILQCVRYIVKNHFFGIGQSDQSTSPASV
ncbi:PREDICTED: nuclear fragile X mental retardation-interacting protein 1-like isoform X2 [Priapulus caudatus]|uniref:Nuclear fragile X mental retardation-interacting protein 1-like isoform X2 n=1 Tax=Priapulus caudatus TaxID=37621 RepID=A0ABM1EV17_PRICU|nr:PREDICTED: nuclear fragile X mental retardation-interacting protein 1-like isoform X2 [Priapulus caudatus]